MKNKFVSFLIVVVLFSGLTVSAQQVNVDMQVFNPLPEVSFAAFLTNPFLKGTPRIMRINLTPHGEEVIVKGSIQWRKVNQGSFNELLHFTTKPFTSRNFYNDDFSSIDGIEIEESGSNDDLLQANLKKGKPTGTYKVIIEVYDLNMTFLDSETTDLDFLNPSQTLSIIEPNVGELLDIAGVLITWTDVAGVSDFSIRANYRASKFESLEEALQKGNPLVNDRNVGQRRSVNLKDILDRELIGGKEVVVQVKATIDAPGGATTIYSDIVNFRLKGATSAVTDKGVKEFETLLLRVIDDLKNIDNKRELQGSTKQDVAQNSEIEDAMSRLQKLLSDIQNGTISFNDINIKFGNGRMLTYAEFQEILEYLRRNPELLTNIFFEEK